MYWLYETSALGMRKWLTGFQESILEPKHKAADWAKDFHAKPLGEDELESDLRLISPTDPIVKKLIIHRNTEIAHIGESMVLSDKNVWSDHPLDQADYDELLRRAERILNRYSTIFDGAQFGMQMESKDDYLLLLAQLKP